MTLLETIRDIILKDKQDKENRYWELEYQPLNRMLVINPIGKLTYDKVTFMGEILLKESYWNSYLLLLHQKYPVNIHFTPSSGCQIYYDTKRLRKYKISKLLTT
jgi:hypothetical protein